MVKINITFVLFADIIAILVWCGKYVSSQTCSSSTIQSPGYPGSYPENLDCSWTKSTYGSRIMTFVISNLDLEKCTRCTCDYVEVFDGGSTSSRSLGKFCSGQVRLLTTGTYLTVVFHSDHSRGEKQNQGFQASYSGVSRSSVCEKGWNTIRTNYANYGNMNCSWTLQSSSVYIVVLNVSSLSFGTCSSSCSCGQLEVFDTSASSQTKIGSWCSLPQKSIVSNGNSMLVRLVTSSTSGHTFKATYKYIKELKVCKHATDLEAKTFSQTLKSYDRPSQYIQLVDCTWKIVAKDDHVIRFTVSQLDMGGCTSCGFLQIFDGQTEWIGTNLGKWRSSNPDMVSSGKYMTVKFKTTKFDTNNGLIAQYYAIPKTSICSKLTDDQGVLESYNYPNSYPGNMNCFWKLEAPPNYLVRFYADDLRLISPNCEERCNFLAVYDGPSISDTKLGAYKENDVSLVSSSSQLAVVLKTYKEGVKGLRGNYQFIHKNEVCKDDLNLQASTFGQTISSRNFPEKYWGNMRCFWRIQGKQDHKIRMIVQTIDFELCTDCGCDFIQIFDGPNENSNSLRKWCQKRPDLISSGNYLYIKMQTDANNSYRGFKAKVFSIHKNDVCPGSGILTKEAGTIKSPNFPEHYFGGIECDWTIVVPDGKRIRVKSKSLNLESCISCGLCDHIEISDDSLDNPIVGKWCKTNFDVISRGSAINIKFISNVNDVGENFVIEYEAVNDDKVCPVNPSSDTSGAVTSLGYPNQNYPGNLNCTYRIKAPKDNQVVRLEFTDFQLASCGQHVSSCLVCGDALQAIDVGDDAQMARFHPWCSAGPQPSHIFSSGQSLFLNFYTDDSAENKGFRATFRSVDKNLACLGTGTLLKRSGNFSGPQSPFNSETLCTWLIKGPANHKIELTFRYSSVTDRDCSFAYVEVYDGDSPTKTSFGRFCEHFWWRKVTSSGSSLYVTLWVDSTIKSNGVPLFYAKYEAVNENKSGKSVKFENMIIGFLVVSSLFILM